MITFVDVIDELRKRGLTTYYAINLFPVAENKNNYYFDIYLKMLSEIGWTKGQLFRDFFILSRYKDTSSIDELTKHILNNYNTFMNKLKAARKKLNKDEYNNFINRQLESTTLLIDKKRAKSDPFIKYENITKFEPITYKEIKPLLYKAAKAIDAKWANSVFDKPFKTIMTLKREILKRIFKTIRF